MHTACVLRQPMRPKWGEGRLNAMTKRFSKRYSSCSLRILLKKSVKSSQGVRRLGRRSSARLVPWLPVHRLAAGATAPAPACMPVRHRHGERAPAAFGVVVAIANHDVHQQAPFEAAAPAAAATAAATTTACCGWHVGAIRALRAWHAACVADTVAQHEWRRHAPLRPSMAACMRRLHRATSMRQAGLLRLLCLWRLWRLRCGGWRALRRGQHLLTWRQLQLWLQGGRSRCSRRRRQRLRRLRL